MNWQSRCYRWTTNVLLALLVLVVFTVAAQAADDTGLDTVDAAALQDSTTVPSEGLDVFTLQMMISQGGPILWVIIGLGFFAFVLSMYLTITLTQKREIPPNLVKRAHSQISAGELRGAFQMCQGRDELLANVLRAGLKMAGHERYVIQEAMESEGERGATALWQKISYLNNIATLSPLLGLLGTVWGMMNAFGVIATEDAQVKGMAMAYHVATAMVTTAAGLVLAIPAMAIFFYLRGRVIKIVAEVEAQASEFVELIAQGGEE